MNKKSKSKYNYLVLARHYDSEESSELGDIGAKVADMVYEDGVRETSKVFKELISELQEHTDSLLRGSEEGVELAARIEQSCNCLEKKLDHRYSLGCRIGEGLKQSLIKASDEGRFPGCGFDLERVNKGFDLYKSLSSVGSELYNSIEEIEYYLTYIDVSGGGILVKGFFEKIESIKNVADRIRQKCNAFE